MTGPSLNKDPKKAGDLSSDEGRPGSGLETKTQAGGLSFAIAGVSEFSPTGEPSYQRLNLQAALGGRQNGPVGISRYGQTDQFRAHIAPQSGASSDALDNFLGAIKGKGSVSLAHSPKTNNTTGQLRFSDGSNNISAKVDGSNAQIVFAGQAVRDWSAAYLKNGANISQVTAHLHNGQLTLTPTVGVELANGVLVTNSIDMNQLFSAIVDRESVYRHSLSGARSDQSSGYHVGDKRVLFNQYNFNQTGASILSLDLFDKDKRNEGVTILLGTLPDMGSFVGGRWRYEASTLNGAALNQEHRAALAANSNREVYQIHAQGDLLFVRAPDGTQRIVGELSFERSNEDRSAALKVNLYKNLGMQEGLDTGFEVPLDFFFEYRW